MTPTAGAVSNVSTPVIDAAEERSPTFIGRARVSIVVSDAESAPIIAEWTNGRGARVAPVWRRDPHGNDDNIPEERATILPEAVAI